MVEEMIDVATMFTPFNDFDRLAASLFARQGLREMPMDLYRDGDQYILRTCPASTRRASTSTSTASC